MHRFALTLCAFTALALAGTSPARAAPPAAPLQAHPAGTAAHAAEAEPPATTAAPAAAPAAVHREYYIEIVVFRALSTLGSPEDWQAELHMAPNVSGSESPTGTGVGHLVSIVPPSGYKLTGIWNALRASADYRPVAHAAWIQTASDWGTHAGFNLSELGVQVPGLSGLVYFERGTYLHLGLTLDYTMQHPPAGLDAPPGTTFVMNETRRVRFYQRNYFDHPAFGVIALVLPVRHPS
ncbi:MAG: CsiV family protein [Steroidobacteraceae bacterium]